MDPTLYPFGVHAREECFQRKPFRATRTCGLCHPARCRYLPSPWVRHSVAASSRQLSSLSTRRGARRLGVSVSINDLAVYMGADAVGGFASAEFAITLRVFDGERVVATRRVPVERFAATIVGFNRLNRRFPPMILGCEFERSSTSDPGAYLMVVEFETIASSFGIGNA